jgi:predicted phage terminase large subunit-like protein
MEVPQEIYQDFRNHLYFTMKYLGLGEPTPLQYAIAEEVQNGQKDMQLQAGRGAGKSTIVASYASWLLLNNPDTTIMVLSATQDRAIKFIAQVRQILTLVPYMAHLLPKEFDKDNAFGFNVGTRSKIGQDMSCYAKGITGQITGSHADYVLGDDIEIEKNADTPAARNKLIDKLAELEQIRNPVSWGRIVLLGTFQSTDSIYLRLPYPIVKFPAVMPDPSIESEITNVHPYILELEAEVGHSVDPTRFPQHILDERLAKIGPRQFNLHYKLDPTLSDFAKFPLRLEDLIVMDCSPEIFPEKIVWGRGQPLKIPSYGINGDLIYGPMWKSETMKQYNETVLFVDPSGRGADETAVCVASFVNGYIVIHALTGIDGGYDESTLVKIARLAMQYNANIIRVESNYGDGMFSSLLRPVVARVAGRIAIEEFKVSGNKERRILDTLEPVMSQHRLIFDTSAINNKETQIQLTRMQDKRGALKHDDRVDILASAVKNWADEMIINPDVLIERNKEKEHRETVKNWLSNERIFTLLPDRMSGALAGVQKNKTARSILDRHYRR